MCMDMRLIVFSADNIMLKRVHIRRYIDIPETGDNTNIQPDYYQPLVKMDDLDLSYYENSDSKYLYQ